MRIEDWRSSFIIYLIASDVDRVEGAVEALRLSGYMVVTFTELTAAFSELTSNPPHFVILDASETKFRVANAIAQVMEQLPESHVFLMTPIDQRERVIPLLEKGVYDLIYMPLVSQIELLKALDRAAERDYFMYKSESLAAPSALPEAEEVLTEAVARPAGSEISQAALSEFGRVLFEGRTTDESVKAFLRPASRLLNGAPVLFFKWIPNRRVLLAAQAENLENFDLGGLGINFNELGPGFKASSLRQPMQVSALTDMVTEVFSTHDYFARPLDVLGELQGVFVFLHAPLPAEREALLADGLFLLSKSLGLLEAERRLHVSAVKDLATDVLNRAHFILRIQQEISRARRTQLPVSLLSISIDQYPDVAAALGQEEAQTLLRMAARIFEKCSRVNDVIGRTGADELGLLLPHTSKKGAMIKAERLRRLLRQADFSKVLSSFPQVTLSIGVSEYPTLVRDAEELLQSAEDVLYQVRKQGNRTGVAPRPENFTPDFEVGERDAL